MAGSAVIASAMRICSGVSARGRPMATPSAARKPRSRKESRLTTIRHGGPPALRIGMRSAERGSKSVVFIATGGRWYHATRSEGGCGRIPTQDGAKPLSFISLIPLWLSPLNRPAMSHEKKKAVTRAPPPKVGGHAAPDSGTEWHTAIRPHDGSLSSSFIPAGRLGTAPRRGC